MKLNYVKTHKHLVRLMVKGGSHCQKKDSRLQKSFFSPILEECVLWACIKQYLCVWITATIQKWSMTTVGIRQLF
uniref:ATARP8 n=1 Tax=Arundo donax TaxID=35708 RepID=A0A0A8YRV0_ARUDO